MDAPPITIRPAAAGEIPAVEALLEGGRLPVDGVREMGDLMLVALEGGRIVGSAGLEIYGTAGLLRSVATAESARGRGVGQLLVERALGVARERGLRRVYLLTETAADFFPRFGFRSVPRGDIDAAVQRSPEFAHLCPASAVAMVYDVPAARSA
jgi:amino-acid N-acetyltransferase